MVGRGRRKSTNIAEIRLAALIVLYHDGVDLTTIDPRILAAAKTEARSSCPVFKDIEAGGEAFEAALDAAPFQMPGSAETFLRAYIEPQLAEPENAPQHVYWLTNKPAFHDLRATLPMEWLERFPQMPQEAMQPLFGIASQYRRQEELITLIDRRCGDPLVDSGKDTEDDSANAVVEYSGSSMPCFFGRQIMTTRGRSSRLIRKQSSASKTDLVGCTRRKTTTIRR